MLRFLTLLLLAFTAQLLTPDQASAQVYAVHISDAKAAKKLRKYLIPINGEDVLVGEPKSGLTYDAEKRQIMIGQRVELFVADPKDPTKLPYKFQGTERVETSKRSVVSIQRQDIARARHHLPDQSLYGLAREYRFRLEGIEEQREQLKSIPTGSQEWFPLHKRLVGEMEKLQTWLASTAFPDAAEKMDKDIEKELKIIRKNASDARLRRSLDSVRVAETPANLVQAAEDLTGGLLKFGMVESDHVRILYATEVMSESTALELIQLAERLIDGFKTDFVDPYLSDDYKDTIPDRLIQEFFFIPNNVDYHEKFYTGYYGQSFGDRKEEMLKSNGTRGNLNLPVRALNFWRVDNADAEGLVTHGLGHTLSEFHYGGAVSSVRSDWLAEGVGYYLSLEYLGRNNVTCKGFDHKDEGYVKREEEKRKRGEKPVKLGLRDFFNSVALEKGERIDKIALKILFELDEADLSKAWSFYDFIAREEGYEGQLFLRACGQYSRDPKTFIAKWRESANATYDIQGRDVFKEIDDRWRAYAMRGQDTSEDARRRR